MKKLCLNSPIRILSGRGETAVITESSRMIRLNPGLMARSTNRRRYIDSGTNYPLSSLRTRKGLSDISAEGAASAPSSRSFLKGVSFQCKRCSLILD
ncbi:hypothetical protein NPIL_183011 [Nephila pilipes]|uniref:Uncharacterized protein n=1 Tax=Nephila pilipes TaxID=299642 RepID=A0A8X6P4F6_NEPPI|nr:hypothetical protein NPIL_183011 [Nephila pilipes]